MLNKLIDYRREKLFYYSPFTFLKNIESNLFIDTQIIQPIKEKLNNANYKTFETIINGHNFLFLYEKQNWETEYFGRNIYKIDNILFETSDLYEISEAIN